MLHPTSCCRASVPFSVSLSLLAAAGQALTLSIVYFSFRAPVRFCLRAAPLHVRESMTSKKPSRRQLLSFCSEIRSDDGVDPRTFFRKSGRKPNNRKVLQMCGEIARTLSGVLAWESGDDVLRGLAVDAVEPALIVHACSSPSIFRRLWKMWMSARCLSAWTTAAASSARRWRPPSIANACRNWYSASSPEGRCPRERSIHGGPALVGRTTAR